MKLPTHPAQFLRWILITAFAVSVSACETTGGFSLSGGPSEAKATRLAERGEHAEAAATLIGLAAERAGVERQRLTLLAVDQWLDAEDIDRARSAFSEVPPLSSGPLASLWSTNDAGIALADGESERALEILERLSAQPMSNEDRLRVQSRRADAWFAMEEPSRAIELLTLRETWLDSSDAIEQNRLRLWKGLLATQPAVLRDAASSSRDEDIQAWLTLGSLAVTTGQQGIGWSNGIVRWRERHAVHPAYLILDELEFDDDILLDYPRRVALLLPLSGRTASAGQAIQNGFLGAYFATAGGLDDRQSVRIYDVNAEGGPVAAYEAAVSDGAEFVVGPLLRSSVAELANDILVPVPVLTLNYLPNDTLAPPGLFQFGLSPEDEAIAAAERAILDGHQRAVALVPNSSWGRRVLQAFVQHFEFLGGTALDYRMYTPGNPDYSRTIEDLMALSGSVRRYNRLRANIGGPLQFDPRRRQDTDFIFLGADAPAGRLLKSQLKFHYSGDLPVYATSSINAMDGRSDTDLNGIRFADVPWLINPQGFIDYLPAVFQEYWPEQRRLGRLHAMGYDAYQLVAPLFANRSGTMPDLYGATGKLRLRPDGSVRRGLSWAEFIEGEPVPLPDMEAPDAEPISVEESDPRDPEDWRESTLEL
ncbi:MAG: penicillin-binding protein activator [Woeseiaceae bacterium]|nr:penicillin-binding protein activator [Woeseiaceae bacterium]